MATTAAAASGNLLDQEWLTTAQVAEMLDVHPETIRVWIRRGELPALAVTPGRGGYRVAKADVEALLRRRYRWAGQMLDAEKPATEE